MLRGVENLCNPMPLPCPRGTPCPMPDASRSALGLAIISRFAFRTPGHGPHATHTTVLCFDFRAPSIVSCTHGTPRSVRLSNIPDTHSGTSVTRVYAAIASSAAAAQRNLSSCCGVEEHLRRRQPERAHGRLAKHRA